MPRPLPLTIPSVPDEHVRVERTAERAKLERRGRVGTIREYARIAVQAALLFGAYGGLGWLEAWVYLGLVAAFQTLLTAVLMWRDPALLNARGGLQPGGKSWDVVLIASVFLLSYASLVVAGLDAGRYGWSSMPSQLAWCGVAVFVPAFGLILWAMAENTHFEGTVRIQTDREHRVCSSGPYARIRHPGYLGMILGNLCVPFILRSWWAGVPIAAAVLLLVLRSALEDGTLQRELPGYAAYSDTTPYRLVPGVW
jgi:protein-S-isoprenylcysteine O-methyltransferase Ste14